MIRLLITEDSIAITEILKAIFRTDSEIEVVGCASNGKEAIHLTETLKPDVILMDITMPVMDGLEATKIIMRTCPTPILILSSLIKDDDPSTGFEALRAGALDIMEKPKLKFHYATINYASGLIQKIKTVSRVKPIHLIPQFNKERLTPPTPLTLRGNAILAIGASTGGPPAILRILKSFTPDFPIPILIVQHIFTGFTQGMVNWLDKNCSIKVKVADQGELVTPGVAYFPPDDLHLGIDQSKRTVLSSEEPLGGHRPSIDFMMKQVAVAYGEKSIGVVLTGMGRDGTEGLRTIKKYGGKSIAQDEKSSVIFGMPKSAIEAGVVDLICPLERIPSTIISLLGIHPTQDHQENPIA